jgi:para-nitrobenzyl esterase
MVAVAGQSYDDTDMKLGKEIGRAWVQFAKTGDPNGAGLRWPRYTAASEKCMEFGDSVGATQLPGTSRIDLLLSIFKELKGAAGKAQLSRSQ